ncbi:ATP-binding cassette domain-containing protein [Saccharopolyspora sp. NPDC000359]|uniref:ABC transporter ATP-binding protein n=1 Tax=Saccharopolyspora sp. NPDC000359 TaxID=3154251 RepID=UPI0033255912
MLIPELTAAENVMTPLLLAGTPGPAARRTAVELLGELGLAGLGDRRIGQLSGGQAQRVAIARARATSARVVFADEPTGALDSRTASEVLGVLLQATSEQGKALVIVTHDEDVARRCSRVLRLRDGRIVESRAGRSRGGGAMSSSRRTGKGRALWMLVRPARTDLSGTGLPIVAFAAVTAIVIGAMTVARAFWAAPDPGGFGQYRILAVAMLAVLVVPASTLGGAAARLSARRREDRLATLRLVGASPAWVRGVALVEAGGLAAAGAVLGTLLAAPIAPALALVPVAGQPLGPARAWLPPALVVVLVLGVVVVAMLSAAASLRQVSASSC